MTRNLADIDTLLAGPKSLFGASTWTEAGPVATMTTTLVDDGGNVIGGMALQLSALVYLPEPRGSAVLVLDRQPLQRLSFRPDHIHVNPARHPIPHPLRRIRLPAKASRLYLWHDDRIWPRPDRLGVAVPLAPEPADLAAAFARFLEECRINGYLPLPPHRPRLELR